MSQTGYFIWFVVTTVCVVALLAGGMVLAVRSTNKPNDSHH